MVEKPVDIFFNRNKLLQIQYLVSIALCLFFCSSVVSASNFSEISRFPKQSPQGSSALKQVADDFSILARLVNGIALQEGFSDGSAKPDDVIAELLSIESGDTVRNLLEMTLDATGISSKLETMLKGVSKLGDNPLTDSSKVKEGVGALNSMKSFAKDLDDGTADGLGKEFIDNFKKIEEGYVSLVSLSDFESLAKYLKAISGYVKPSDDFNVLTGYNEAFKVISSTEDSLGRVLEDFKNYKTISALELLWEIKNGHKVLEPISKISKAGLLYTSNWGTLSSLSTKMDTLKSDANVLLPLTKEYEFHSTVSDSLNPVIELLESLFSDRQSAKTLAEGLRNGPPDLVRIKQDLKEPWLKENIADGKDLTTLSSLFTSIGKFSEQLLKVNEDFVKFKNSTNVLDFSSDFLSVFKVLADDGKTLASSSDVVSSVETLTDATTNLKTIKGSPPFEKFNELFDNAVSISNYADSFDKTFTKMSGIGYTDVGQALIKLKKIAKNVVGKNGLNNADVNDAARKMKEVKGFDTILKLCEIAANELKPLLSGDLNDLITTERDWTTVEKVQKGLEGTGLPEALKTLSEKNINLESIDKILNYGIKVREIKKEKIESLRTILAFIDELRVGLKKTEDTVVTKPRHRRDAGQKSKTLENSKSLALDLGRGVHLLHDLSKAYEKRNILKTSADYPREVSRVISSLKPLKNVWTDSSLKALKELPVELEKLEKFANENKNSKDLIQLGSVFNKASEIQGAPIDSKLLKDHVVPALQKSSKPAAKDAAPTFLELSELELDYSKHSASLKAAILTLSPLRQYFDDVFGITRTSSGQPTQEKVVEKEVVKGLSNEMLLYIVLGICFLIFSVIVAVIMICKCKKEHMYKKRLHDPETWVLLSFTRENELQEPKLTKTNTFDHIVKNNLGAFKKCLSNGAYVDMKVQSNEEPYSLLHMAVANDRPKFIEALIKHGANVETLNHKYETPLQMAKRLKKTKCVKVFKKFEKKKNFKTVLPEPLSKHNYIIQVASDIPTEEHYNGDFFKKFPQYAHSTERPTHCVVKTDKNNVLHVKERHLDMILSASMLMGHRWLKACLDSASNIGNNKEYRVTRMIFEGEIYDTVLDIKDFINRCNVPFLYGTKVYFNNHVLRAEWSLLFKLVRRLGIQQTCDDFPLTNYQKGKQYHRDDLPINFFLYRPCDLDQVKLNFKDVWIKNPAFLFMDTNAFIHFLLAFEIKSKKIAEAEKKNKKNGVVKGGAKKLKDHRKKGKDESDVSNSGPENSNSGPSTMTKTRTPHSTTPGSRTPRSKTPNTATPTSRTPGTRRH